MLTILKGFSEYPVEVGKNEEDLLPREGGGAEDELQLHGGYYIVL